MFSLPFFKTFLSNLAFNHLHCCTKMMNPHGQIKLRGESERENIFLSSLKNKKAGARLNPSIIRSNLGC